MREWILYLRGTCMRMQQTSSEDLLHFLTSSTCEVRSSICKIIALFSSAFSRVTTASLEDKKVASCIVIKYSSRCDNSNSAMASITKFRPLHWLIFEFQKIVDVIISAKLAFNKPRWYLNMAFNKSQLHVFLSEAFQPNSSVTQAVWFKKQCDKRFYRSARILCLWVFNDWFQKRIAPRRTALCRTENSILIRELVSALRGIAI